MEESHCEDSVLVKVSWLNFRLLFSNRKSSNWKKSVRYQTGGRFVEVSSTFPVELKRDSWNEQSQKEISQFVGCCFQKMWSHNQFTLSDHQINIEVRNTLNVIPSILCNAHLSMFISMRSGLVEVLWLRKFIGIQRVHKELWKRENKATVVSLWWMDIPRMKQQWTVAIHYEHRKCDIQPRVNVEDVFSRWDVSCEVVTSHRTSCYFIHSRMMNTSSDHVTTSLQLSTRQDDRSHLEGNTKLN